MSGTATRGEKIKAAFGKISPNIVAEKKKRVGLLITKLETDSTGMTDAPSHLAFHPGAKGVEKTYQTIRSRFDLVKGTDKEQFEAYDKIEKETQGALKALPGMKIGEAKLGDMKKKTPGEIDKIVKDIGPKAKTDEQRGTLIAAIKAKYDLDELGGELTSNALPRLYDALGKVPANHTKDNPMFQKLVRSKMSDTSLYWNGKGTIAINGGEAGPFSSEREKYTDGAGKKLEFNKFDAHTLHEVGHSVDDASGYMAKHASSANHGGWKESDAGAAAIAKAKQMQKDWPNLALGFLVEAVSAALGSGKIDAAVAAWKNKKGAFDSISEQGLRDDPAIMQADVGIRNVMDDVTVPLSSEDKQKIVDECGQLTDAIKPTKRTGAEKTFVLGVIRNMRELVVTADDAIGKMKATIEAANNPQAINKLSEQVLKWVALVTKELWWQGSAIATAQVDGRVYQKDGTKWVSYDFASRGQMVKDYQYRSPAEWFAEVYTVAMLGKLAPSHPCAKTIKDIDTTKKVV